MWLCEIVAAVSNVGVDPKTGVEIKGTMNTWEKNAGLSGNVSVLPS